MITSVEVHSDVARNGLKALIESLRNQVKERNGDFPPGENVDRLTTCLEEIEVMIAPGHPIDVVQLAYLMNEVVIRINAADNTASNALLLTVYKIRSGLPRELDIGMHPYWLFFQGLFEMLQVIEVEVPDIASRMTAHIRETALAHLSIQHTAELEEMAAAAAKEVVH